MIASTLEVCRNLSTALELNDGLWETSCLDFEAKALTRLVEDFGLRVREGNEGAVSSVDDAGSPGDFSRTGQDFDFHSDGLYQAPLPDVVSLFCANPGRRESATVLADAFAAIDSLSEEDVRLGMMLSCVYIGRHGEEYARPLFVDHPRYHRPTLQMASRGYLRPTRLVPSQGGHVTIRDISNFTASLLGVLDAHIVLEKNWEAGDVLFFDNLRFPHARRSRTGNVDPARLLHRTWLDYVR